MIGGREAVERTMNGTVWWDAFLKRYSVWVAGVALLGAGWVARAVFQGVSASEIDANRASIAMNTTAISQIRATLNDLLQETEVANNLMCRRFAAADGVVPPDCQVLFDQRAARERRRN
jgi:hypothetical protein